MKGRPRKAGSEEIITDPASYAARWRSKGEYRLAALIELHTGERRTFGPQGQTLVTRCAWVIADDRRCKSTGDSEGYL